MLDPERILGAMIRRGIRSGRRSRRSRNSSALGGLLGPGLTGAAGLGLIGVAIAAFDHFMEKRSQASPTPTPPAATPPGPAARSSGPALPPPPPPGLPQAVAGLPTSEEERRQQAVLLIRTMIAAAVADGVIDNEERTAILERFGETGLSQEDRTFLEGELAEPPRLDDLLPALRSANLNEQAYAVSLLTIEVDSEAERSFLNYLRLQLGIDERMAGEVHRRLGIEGL